MVGKQEIGRIDVVPPHEHIPPDEAAVCRLAQIAYLDKCALNREAAPELHVPTQEEEDRCILQWGTDEVSTRIALGVYMAHTAGCLGEEETERLAKKIQTYGDEREMAERERYQEQGE